MTNTELFDLLGQIDDKFYEEALGGDSEKPMKIIIERKPFSLKRTLVSVAACLVLGTGIGVTAYMLSRADINKIVRPSDYGEITDSDIAKCKQMLIEQYPNMLRYEEESNSLRLQSRVMDINCDGSDELVLFSRTTNQLFVYTKTADEAELSDNIELPAYGSVNGLDRLYEYDADGEHYWYYSDVRSGIGDVLTVNSMIRIGYDGRDYTADFPLVYGSVPTDMPGSKLWFFEKDIDSAEVEKICSDTAPKSNISVDEFMALWNKHTGLPAFQIYNDFYAEYPLMPSVDEIPVMSENWFDADKTLQKARIECIECGEYELWLLGENIFRNSDSAIGISFRDMKFGLVKDGRLISTSGLYISNPSAGGLANYWFKDWSSDHSFKLYQLDGGSVAVFRYLCNRINAQETNFVAVKDGRLITLMGSSNTNGTGCGYWTNASGDFIVRGDSLIDRQGGLAYSFNPQAFDGNPFENPHFTTQESVPDAIELSEYLPYNGTSADYAAITEKKVGGYTVRLLGHDLQTVKNGGKTLVEHGELFISLEKNGKELLRRRFYNGGGDLDALKLDSYLFTFEMKSGIGFGVYWPFTFDSNPQASLYSISGNGINNIKYADSGASIPGENPLSIPKEFKIIPEDNGIELDEKTLLEIDFKDNVIYQKPASVKVKGTVSSAWHDPKFTHTFPDQLLATQTELNRWNKIAAEKTSIARIEVGYMLSANVEYEMSEEAAARFVNGLFGENLFKVKLFDHLENPATGGGTAVNAYDKNDNFLFYAYCDGYWLTVQFEPEGCEYIFDCKGWDMDQIDWLN